MKVEKIYHVGIAVKNLNETIEFFTQNLGGSLVSKDIVVDQKLVSAMVRLGEDCLEIMESTDEEGVVSKYIRKRGEGVHHISLKVKDLGCLIDSLEKNGVSVIGKQLDSPEIKFAFIAPSSAYGVLIELVEIN